MSQPEHQRIARNWFLRPLKDWEEAQTLAQEDSESPNAVWLTQQAVEKALKSLLLLNQIPFRRIHDLEQLRTLLPRKYRLRRVPKDLSLLSQRGMESRYPGEYDPIHKRDVSLAMLRGAKVIELLHKEFDPLVLHRIDPLTGKPYRK
jgi:HEPN domain-containing protein